MSCEFIFLFFRSCIGNYDAMIFPEKKHFHEREKVSRLQIHDK